MKLTVIADLGHGVKYQYELNVDSNIIATEKRLDKFLQSEFKYASDTVIRSVVDKLRPEDPAQIFARSFADMARRKGVK